MVRAMQGKECLALNLKDPRGREILHRLIREADAFVHSFRPGVPESLGIDYETLQKINPKLVYHYAGSYGSVGPYRRQPAIDPIIAAFAGYHRLPDRRGQPPAERGRRRPDRRRRPRNQPHAGALRPASERARASTSSRP